MDAVGQVAGNIGGAITDTKTRTIGAVSGTATVNTNIQALDTAIGEQTTGTNGNVLATNSVNQNLDELDNEIGADSQYTSTKNGVAGTNSIKTNIDALNKTIGDMDTLQTNVADTSSAEFVRGNLTNGATSALSDLTVADALSNIDKTLGKIHGLRAKLEGGTGTTEDSAGSNLATGTTVEEHLTKLDSAIGNRTAIGSANDNINTGTATSVAAGLTAAGNAIGNQQYTHHRYVTQGSDLTKAVSDLDTGLSNLQDRVNKYHEETKAGFASLAALSALVPNARSGGDTQISVGTGYHRGETGFALGAFHYVNDEVLLNLGAAYAGDASATFRGGVTFGF